jgi:hypothetical protein
VPARAKPPRFFLDRSLGRVTVPALLRTSGLELVTLAERYGVPADQRVSDDVWLRDAGKRRELVLFKDRRIRYRTAEKSAIEKFAVRCFCISSGNLSGEEMASRILANLDRIIEVGAQPGPYIYMVHANRIERVNL